jgi:8-oxo-dGTP diphosphatase
LAEAPRTIRVAAAVIRQGDRYLITQRREGAVLPLLWEFPGGQVEAGENDEQALVRELAERLEAQVEIGCKLGERRHEYQGYAVDLALYEARLTSERLVQRAVRDFRWVASAEFDRYPFPRADQETMDLLLGWRR